MFYGQHKLDKNKGRENTNNLVCCEVLHLCLPRCFFGAFILVEEYAIDWLYFALQKSA